jgi:hypothetical protein
MASRASYQQNDYDGDSTVTGFVIDEVTDANIVALGTAFGTLRSAIEAVTLGVSIRSQFSIESQFNSDKTKASDTSAKRGNKWLVSLNDTQQFLDPPTNSIPNPNFGETFQISIGNADFSLRTNNSDVVYTNTNPGSWSAQMQALATATEALVRSKFGTTGEVIEIRANTVNLS